jgi:hypothetical protein
MGPSPRGGKLGLVYPRVQYWALCCSFYIYVNDMPDIVQNSNVVMFADDSKCYRTVKSSLDTWM